MPNFQKAKIYKLINKITDQPFYIGSTCETLKMRYSLHKYHVKIKHNNSECFKYIEEIGGMNNVDIVLICDYPCENRKELLEEERKQLEIIGFENVKNQNKPYLRQSEKKEQFRINAKKYYYNHKKEILEKSKNKYRESDKTLAKEYYRKNKDRISACAKRFYEKNADKMKLYHEAYRVKNRDRYNEYHRKIRQEATSVSCDCGSKIKSHQNFQHRKTKKHLKYIKENEPYQSDYVQYRK